MVFYSKRKEFQYKIKVIEGSSNERKFLQRPNMSPDFSKCSPKNRKRPLKIFFHWEVFEQVFFCAHFLWAFSIPLAVVELFSGIKNKIDKDLWKYKLLQERVYVQQLTGDWQLKEFHFQVSFTLFWRYKWMDYIDFVLWRDSLSSKTVI